MCEATKLKTSKSESNMFMWPPKEQEPGPLLRPPPTPIHLPNRLVESIETQLLGRTGLAFDKWVQRTGWTRDLSHAFCWRCGGSVGEHESDGDGCATCRSKSLPWDRAVRLGRYKGILREEILALKFHAWRPTGKGLGEHLGLSIRNQLERAQIAPDRVVLVPIPMHRFRRLSRGIDHTMVLAKAASASSGCKVASLLSTRYRPEQVGLSMTARARNMKGAFFVSGSSQRKLRRSIAQNRRVCVLIDDVRTTGATFVAACKALKLGLKDAGATNSGADSGGLGACMIWICCIGVAGESRDGRATEI